MRRRWGGVLALVAIALATGLPSFVRKPAPRPDEIRLSPSEARLVANGHVVRTVPLDPAARPLRLEALARAIGESGWIDQPIPGVFELHAALIQEPGTDLLVGAPAVSELRLLTRPGMQVRASAAKARFEGVKVTSWDGAKGAPPADHTAARPFLLYEDGSRLEVVRSELAYLGYDSRGMSTPGVSWRRKGTTGEAVESTFHHSFLGAYASEAERVAFKGNVFRDNERQGLSVRGPASGIVVEANEVFGNGADGVLVAGVADSTLADNRVHANAGNGITLRGVDRSRVTGNLVEGSGKDGIVLSGSSANLVRANIARAQRDGVRVDGSSAGNAIEENRLEATRTGLRLSGRSTGARLTGNQVDGAPVGVVLDAPGTTMVSTTVRAAPLAVDVRRAVSVSQLVARGAERGVVVRRGARADLDHLDIEASRLGLKIESGGDASLTRSRLVAQTPLAGAQLRSSADNALVAVGDTAPLPWLAAAAILILLLAVGLEMFHSRRNRAVHDPVGTARPVRYVTERAA